MRRRSGLGAEGRRRVALAGMLLAVQLIPDPEMAAHLQVQATVRAGVAARVAVPALLDADCLVPVRRERAEPRAISRGGNTLPFPFPDPESGPEDLGGAQIFSDP